MPQALLERQEFDFTDLDHRMREADQAIAGRKQFSISSPCDPLRSEPRLLIRSLDETDLCQRSDPLGKI